LIATAQVKIVKILVVEDDPLVADALKSILVDHQYAVEIADDGQVGLDFIEAFDYDLLLLDVMLPKVDGISICRYVRSGGYMMPILLLTGQDSKHDRAIGLDAGADDYVVKPFDPEELSARIRALLRRGDDRLRPVLSWGDLTLDPHNYEVTYQHQLLSLTPKEYALLELFLRHSRRLFSCGAILEHLWTYADTPSEEAVRTHIKGLRHKLKAAGAPNDFLETVYGIGYRLKPSGGGNGERGEEEDRTIEISNIDRSVEIVDADFLPENHQISGENHSSTAVEAALTNISPTESIRDLPEFLTVIWNKHYPEMLDRIATIDQAAIALQELSLTPEIRKLAWQDAHTLAGSLGTFGLSLGSQAAKKIELLLRENTNLTPIQLPELQSSLDLLLAEVTRKAPAAPTAIVETPQCQSPWLLLLSKEPQLGSALSCAAAGKFEIVSAIELAPAQLTQPPAAIILDLDCFPQPTTGLMVLSELDRDYPDLPVIVLSLPVTTDHSRSPEQIAVMSADSLQQRIEVARRGARLFLLKPSPVSQILQAVDRVLSPARASQIKVTIVDDDQSILDSVSALLSRQGMTVTTLAKPSRFWEILETSTPDLLILDLDMPTHDGIELCQAVRTDPQWASLPILFLTAHTAAVAIDRVFAAGADDFVTKPFVGANLITRVINRLQRSALHQI
jgi:DNA-binding response OmpR family regulator/HPt (histidine-containing phosphotransfer) domain-containing protein